MDIISTDYESVGRVGGGVGHALYIQKKNENWGCVSTIRLLVSLQLLQSLVNIYNLLVYVFVFFVSWLIECRYRFISLFFSFSFGSCYSIPPDKALKIKRECFGWMLISRRMMISESLRRVPLEKRRLILNDRQQDAFDVRTQLGVDILLFPQSRPDLGNYLYRKKKERKI